MEETIIDRINFFIRESGLTRSQFADACGIPRPTISQILCGKNKKIGDDVISIIHKTYPKIPMLWLLFGEGDMPEFPKVDDVSIFEKKMPITCENANLSASNFAEPNNLAMQRRGVHQKKISKIVVFFDDNSFEEYYLGK